MTQSATINSTMTRSSVTTHTSLTDPITGEVVRIVHPAWTGGRDRDYALLEEVDERGPSSADVRGVSAMGPSSWGGSWTSPGHLRILQNRVARREDPSHA
jgi:ribosomal protein L31